MYPAVSTSRDIVCDRNAVALAPWQVLHLPLRKHQSDVERQTLMLRSAVEKQDGTDARACRVCFVGGGGWDGVLS